MATLTVLAALLPMLFVSGLMGPYMAPIPVNASAAMVFSFFVAVVIAPWLMVRFAARRWPPATPRDTGKARSDAFTAGSPRGSSPPAGRPAGSTPHVEPAAEAAPLRKIG